MGLGRFLHLFLATQELRKPPAMALEQTTQIEDRRRTLVTIPRRWVPPSRLAEGGVELKLRQPQEALSDYLYLERTQDRLFRPRTAFLPTIARCLADQGHGDQFQQGSGGAAPR